MATASHVAIPVTHAWNEFRTLEARGVELRRLAADAYCALYEQLSYSRAWAGRNLLINTPDVLHSPKDNNRKIILRKMDSEVRQALGLFFPFLPLVCF